MNLLSWAKHKKHYAFQLRHSATLSLEGSSLTKTHLERVKYEAKHTVGLVENAIFRSNVLDQAKTTSPSGPDKGGKTGALVTGSVVLNTDEQTRACEESLDKYHAVQTAETHVADHCPEGNSQI